MIERNLIFYSRIKNVLDNLNRVETILESFLSSNDLDILKDICAFYSLFIPSINIATEETVTFN